MIQIAQSDAPVELTAVQQRALDILSEHRARVLSGLDLRSIAVITVYNPEATDPPDVASITAVDWSCAKGVIPAEIVGILFGAATGISRGAT